MTTNTDTTAASGAASLGPLNDRAIKDAIRNAYDLGYRDGAHAGASAAHQVEQDHGGALIHALYRALAAPAAQEAEPATSAPVEGTAAGWKSHAEAMERERDYYRQRVRTLDEHQEGQVWYWQNDGGDHLESMVNSLPVVIRADQLRALLAVAARPQADVGAPETPEGCTPADARMLRQANHDLAAESFELQQALRGIVAQAGGALARFDIAPQADAGAVPGACGDDDHVLVPRHLIGSACAAMARKLDAPKTIAELRRYTTGDLSAAAPQAPAAPTAAACAYAPLPKPYSAAAALGLDDLYTGDDMRAYADAHRGAPAPAAGAQDMESVLIDGVAYQTPAPVAAELLRLHLEAMEAPAAPTADDALNAAVEKSWDRFQQAMKPADGEPPAVPYAQHERELSAEVDQREQAESVIDLLCDAVLGPDRQEWSSAYGYQSAINDVAERIAELEHKAAQAPAAGAAPSEDEEKTQPWYDLAWKHGAKQHASMGGDELASLEFFPGDFESFCAALALGAAAPAQEAEDGWMPIETAPEGERVLLGPRHAPVVGTVHRPEHWHEEQEPTVSVVHYNGNVLVAGYRCSEWHRLPGAARARQEGGAA